MVDNNAVITEVSDKLSDTQLGEILKQKKAKSQPKAETPAPAQEAKPAEAKPVEAKAATEKPVVTPEAKKEEKVENPVDAKPKKKSAKESVNEFFKPKQAEAKAPDISELQKALDAEKEARIKLEQELKDPVYEVAKAIKSQGKKALDVFKEIKVIDHSKMSDEELIRYELGKIGVTDSEEIENELLKFNEQSAIQKRKEIEAIRKGIDYDNENTERQFLQKINAKDPDEERLIQQAMKQGEELQNTILSLVDKPVVEGVVFTKDIANKILDNIANSRVAIPKKEDGTIDIESLVQREIKAEMFDLCIEVLTANTEAETIHKVYNEFEATPDSFTQTSRPPQPIHKVEKGSDEYGKQVSSTLRPI